MTDKILWAVAAVTMAAGTALNLTHAGHSTAADVGMWADLAVSAGALLTGYGRMIARGGVS
jgi:hypothetical protein